MESEADDGQTLMTSFGILSTSIDVHSRAIHMPAGALSIELRRSRNCSTSSLVDHDAETAGATITTLVVLIIFLRF